MDLTLEAYLAGLRGKRVTVIGIGVSNRPLLRLLAGAGAKVTARDRKTEEQLGDIVPRLREWGVELVLGEDYMEGIGGDVVFRTPSLRPDHPGLLAAVEQGARLTSEMEVFFEVCPCPVIAVTGSDGKTTTTTVIAEMLRAAGKTVWLGGNIGTPLLPLCREMKPEDYAVVELSSFQLMDMKRSPQRAVITNLAPNHLDIHRDMEEYVDAKKNIFRYQKEGDLLVVNADNPITAPFRGPGETRTFSRLGEGDVCVRDGVIFRGGRKVLPVSDILLPGVHNVENYMAAIAVVEGLAPDEDIRQVARTFGGVEHRIELVRVKDGVRYYNDSIASSPTRTMAGLRSFPEKVILIAGGYDKHIPYDPLGPEICAHVKKLFLNGATGPKIRAAVERCPGEKPEMVDCGDFASAVKAAAAAAEPGDVVLMSPASAAIDQFRNFMVRGNYFKELVKEL